MGPVSVTGKLPEPGCLGLTSTWLTAHPGPHQVGGLPWGQLCRWVGVSPPRGAAAQTLGLRVCRVGTQLCGWRTADRAARPPSCWAAGVGTAHGHLSARPLTPLPGTRLLGPRVGLASGVRRAWALSAAGMVGSTAPRRGLETRGGCGGEGGAPVSRCAWGGRGGLLAAGFLRASPSFSAPPNTTGPTAPLRGLGPDPRLGNARGSCHGCRASWGPGTFSSSSRPCGQCLLMKY